ncbi:NrfD/PsrC family molybdoenzyme membrane anchor subunit [Cryobacterium fucosi]|uniref:Molybdopterin oxidoreductase n=1 Tax=Cryobacterium fucosi TaxID=1259157 RepID=A0A4R9B4S5_9MICO|nr:NrfD/PsrC family molybdoenzyme membrane anchor subunit [Cryobacterium fucosi]TFD75647.1 molybdopterin oxidoreductase [Cryobacterium fucosi]
MSIRTAASTVESIQAGNHTDGRVRRNKPVWYGFLGVVMLATAWPVWLRLSEGLAVTDLTSQMPWGAWIAFYIFFVGLSAGAFLLSSLVYVFGMHQFERIGRAALLSAIVSMGVALAFVGFDLGRFERGPITLIFFHWTSPLSWEVRFYVIYIALLTAELVIALRVHKRMVWSVKKSLRWLKILGTVGLPLAIFGVHGGTGTIFAVVKARGMWFGGLFPVIFVVSAMVSGTALLILVHYWQSRASYRRPSKSLLNGLGVVLSGVLAVDLGLLFYEFVVPLLASEHQDLSIITVMTTGPFWWSFWIVQLLCGMIIPFVILVVPRFRANTPAVVLAATMVVIGIVAVRFNIVVPALIPPIIEGYPSNDYFPTLVEWASSAFFIAGGMLVYSLIAEWMPIHEPDPVDELEEDSMVSPEKEVKA